MDWLLVFRILNSSLGTVLQYNATNTINVAAKGQNFSGLLTVPAGTWILIAHCQINPSNAKDNYVQLHFIGSSDDSWGNGGNGGDWSSG